MGWKTYKQSLKSQIDPLQTSLGSYFSMILQHACSLRNAADVSELVSCCGRSGGLLSLALLIAFSASSASDLLVGSCWYFFTADSAVLAS